MRDSTTSTSMQALPVLAASRLHWCCMWGPCIGRVFQILQPECTNKSRFTVMELQKTLLQAEGLDWVGTYVCQDVSDLQQ